MLCFETLLYTGTLTVGMYPLVLRYTWLGQSEMEPTVLFIRDPVPLVDDGHRASESQKKQANQRRNYEQKATTTSVGVEVPGWESSVCDVSRRGSWVRRGEREKEHTP